MSSGDDGYPGPGGQTPLPWQSSGPLPPEASPDGRPAPPPGGPQAGQQPPQHPRQYPQRDHGEQGQSHGQPHGQPYPQQYGPPPHGQPPPGQPLIQPPPAQPYGQGPYGQGPYGQDPYGRPPYGMPEGPAQGGAWQGSGGGRQGPTPPAPALWQTPTQPSPSRRRGWVIPSVAITAVLAVAGGTFAVMKVRDGGVSPAPAATAAAASPAVTSSAAADLSKTDACAMLDPAETGRLVPAAKIDSSMRDNRDDAIVSYVRWTCSWVNRDISYKDKRRSREITVNVSRYEGLGNTTAEKAARIQFDGELKQYRYQEKVSTKERYYSKAKEFAGIGEQAAAQYQWTREKDYWYSFGQGVGRVGNVVFQVKYEANQKDKEAAIFSTETTQSITEENALREVENLLGQLGKSVTAWRSGQAMPFKPRPKPSPTPSPKPTLIALPEPCVSVRSQVETLVPKTEGVAARSVEDGATVTQCQWWNDKLPIGQGKVRWRNLRINVYAFADADSARYRFIDERAKAKTTASSGIGGIRWGKLRKLPGFGQDSFGQAIRQRTDTAQSNRYEIYVLDGTKVVWVLFSGSDRPENTPINAPDSLLMDSKEAAAGARSVTRTVLGAL
ncbi:hypothetical protein ACQP1K_08780 [Sphaerimonospora sp. CA-214678]|uniref:hypothetical protein n=1 Tax=Sphaerimonospora sp. CA-214678 TaxID=3240029 RepID=UPI003D94C816